MLLFFNIILTLKYEVTGNSRQIRKIQVNKPQTFKLKQ